MTKEPTEHRLAKPQEPMWKTFMVTDINRIGRVSGTIHAKLEKNRPEIGQFELPASNPQGEGEKEKPDAKSANLGSREIFLRPIFSAPEEIKTPPSPLPSRDEGVLFQLKTPDPASGKPGILIRKLKGLGEPKEKEE